MPTTPAKRRPTPPPVEEEFEEPEGLNPEALDMSIDIERLDHEWLYQPLKVKEVSDALAQAKLEEQEAKQELEVARADTRLRMLEDPGSFQLPKTTEDTLAAALVLQKPVQRAQRAYNQATYKAELLRGTLNALSHRKSALESLVDLHGRDYFSTPRAGTEGGRRHLHEQQKRGVIERTRRSNDEVE